MGGYPDVPLAVTHGPSGRMEVTNAHKCIKIQGIGLPTVKLKDFHCNTANSFKACLIRKDNFASGLNNLLLMFAFSAYGRLRTNMALCLSIFLCPEWLCSAYQWCDPSIF